MGILILAIGSQIFITGVKSAFHLP